MRIALAVILLLPSLAFAATQDQATPAAAYRALQKAADARDVDAMAALLSPDERDALRAEVAAFDVVTVARRVPKGALKITSESADIVSGEADGRSILFIRADGRWYVAAAFAKPKKPVAVIQVQPTVRAEKADVLTVAPIRGAGLPNEHAISASEAYELLRTEARRLRPGARLYALDTGMHGLSAEGASSGWSADFLTGTAGELLNLGYRDGEFGEPSLSAIAGNRQGVPEEETLSYDTRKLYEETLKHAAGVVNPITLVTASLYRSAGSGKPLWLVNVYNDDDRIGTTVVFDARGLVFSHKTK
jgi:hypothetical protein